MRFHLPKAFINPLSLLGAIIATVALGASTFALCLDIFGVTDRPYQGILTFFVFPAFLFAGIGIVFGGFILQRRRMKSSTRDLADYPVIDLNDPRQRRFWLISGAAGSVILLLSLLGSYRAYEFTDSVTFCGELCHKVMEPEFTAYQSSPHARVKCVDCHVGAGAQWYVKAKFSGLYQIYAAFADKYPRPIPTPVENLRPAQDTCEQCHWPQKFWGAQLSRRQRYQYDPLNTRRDLLMLVKTGGGSPAHGPSEGIHWHMSISNRIEYVARDRHRMEIPWIKTTAPDGTVTVYVDPKSPPTEEELRTLEHRRLDCMDCHNRPSHVYLSPEEAADLSLQTGALDASVPWIKEAAVAALAGEYKDRAGADAGIETSLRDFYAKKGPDLAGETEPRILAIAAELRKAYHKNFFPEMRADWSAYPNQIGHRLYPGCFRCHDKRHQSESGKVIGRNCSGTCHSFLEGAAGGGLSITAQGTYAHPFKSPSHFEKMECWTCHTGKASPYGTCAKCHEFEVGAPMAFACSGCHKTTKEKVENVDCRDCHDPAGSKLHAVKEHQDCLACHKEHDWNKIEVPASCTDGDCHKALKKPHYDDQPCLPCHKEFKGGKGFRMVLARPPDGGGGRP